MKLRKVAAMLIALLLCLPVVSPPVYAYTTSTVSIANTSMQMCLRRVCRDIINSVPVPDAELENLLGKDYYFNECVKGKVSQLVCEAEQVYGIDDSGKLKVPQDVTESLQKLDTLNERLNDSGSSQKIVIPTQKPRQGIENAKRVTGLYASQVQEDVANADGFFSASAAYLSYLGIAPVFITGLVQDGVVYYTPELEAVDTALSLTSLPNMAKGLVKRAPYFYKDIAFLLRKNPKNAGKGGVKLLTHLRGVGGNGAASELGNLGFRNAKEVGKLLKNAGFEGKSISKSGYQRFKHSDGSEVWVNWKTGRVVRNAAPRYGANGVRINKGQRLGFDGAEIPRNIPHDQHPVEVFIP